MRNKLWTNIIFIILFVCSMKSQSVHAVTLEQMNTTSVQTATNKTFTSVKLNTDLTLNQTTANYTLVWNNPAAGRTLTISDPLGDDTLAFLSATQTFTNKTLTAPVLGGTITGTYTLGGTPTVTNPTVSTGTFTSPTVTNPTVSTGTFTSPTFITPKQLHANVVSLDKYSTTDICATTTGALDQIGSAVTTLLIPSAATCTTSKTVPSTLTLWFLGQGQITISTGVTLTISGAIFAPLQQIFVASGTAAVRGNTVIDQVEVVWFGAIDDTVTDGSGTNNTTAIQKAADWAANNGIALNFIHHDGRMYRISTAGGVNLTNIRDIRMNGAVITADAGIGTAVTVGGNTSTTLSNANISIRVKRQHTVAGTWSGGDLNVQIQNVNNSYFWIQSTHGETGLKLTVTDAARTAYYNKIYLQNMTVNKLAIEVSTAFTDTVNSNNFLGGTLSNAETGATGGIKIQAANTTIFHYPSIEYTADANHTNIILDNAKYNQVLQVLIEEGGFNAINVSAINGSYGNLVIPSRFDGIWTVNDNNSIGTINDFDNYVYNQTELDKFGFQVPVIMQHFNAYDDGAFIYSPDFLFYSQGTDAFSYRVATGGNYIIKPVYENTQLDKDDRGDNFINLKSTTDGVGVIITDPGELYVDIVYDNAADTKPELYIICYNGSWTKLTGISPYYVTGRSITSSGNIYRSYYKGILRFNSGVKYAFISAVVATGKTDANIRYMEIRSNKARRLIYSNTVSSLTRNTIGRMYASQSPTKSAFPVGTVLWEDIPTAANPAGWMCIRRIDTTLTANAIAGATSLTVASTTNMVVNDVIGIQMNDGTGWHWTTIATIPNGTSLTITAGLGFAANSGNVVVTDFFKAQANLAAFDFDSYYYWFYNRWVG